MSGERADRLVRVSPELMASWTSMRTVDGYLVTMDWGERGADGFYEPVLTQHNDDRLVPAPDWKRVEVWDGNGNRTLQALVRSVDAAAVRAFLAARGDDVYVDDVPVAAA